MFGEVFFELGEFAHADGEVVGFEDLLTEDEFEDVFEGDESGGRAKFVDGDGELLMIFEEGLEGISGGGGFGDEADGLHEVADDSVVLSVDHVFAADDADDVFDIIFVDGEAGEGDGRVFFENFFKGEFVVEGCYDLARSFEFAYRDIVEGEGVGDHDALIICEGAFLGSLFGEEDDFVVVVVFGCTDGVDEESDGFFADKGDWAH